MSIVEKLNKIETKNILVIGDVMLDRYFFGISKRISPEAPVPVLLKQSERIVLGGAANVAINIRKAKQKVSILSVVGNDQNADVLLNILKDNNIDSKFIIKDDERYTIVKNRFIGQNNIQMFRYDEEIKKDLNSEINNKIYKILEENVSNYDIVVISDYNKGLLNTINTSKIIEIANKNSVKTIIDIKEPNYEKYKNAYLIKPNVLELQDITKMNVETEEEIEKASKTLLENANCQYVLTTRGKDGMMLVSKDKSIKIKCESREVYDVTGAGDTVISYLAVGLSNKISLIDSIQMANYAAGVEVSKMGTYAVTIEEIKDYINKENDVNYEDKIVSIDKLKEVLKNRENKTIVFTNGCFDIFHVGHARYLREASKLGDMLIVGVNSDTSVKRLKGEKRPIVTENERMELLAALEFVSYVILFEEDTPYNIIKQIQPDIIAKGGDYKPEDVVGKDIVEKRNGKVVICPLIENKSTTNIIKKIKGE